MLKIERIRFALAHVSWPWCDEAIAVYGKFCAMQENPKYAGQQMYIDLSPGTPACYREGVLRMLYEVGYPGMDERLLFGSDSFIGTFHGKSVRELAESDAALLMKAGFNQMACEYILGKNAEAFWGL